MKSRLTLNVFNKEITLFFGVQNQYNKWKTGITNRCKDGQFVLFLDYDKVPYSWVVDELDHIQKHHKLGDIHIFQTNNGYHAINTEKRSFQEILKIMNQTSADIHFINVPLKYGKKAWTLRISNKKGKMIKHISTFPAKNKKVMSAPHNWYLREMYGLVINGTDDEEQSFYISKYPINE